MGPHPPGSSRSKFVALVSLLLLAAGCGGPDVAPDDLPASGNPDIAEILKQVAAEYRLVGMGAGLIEADGGVEIAVAGRRVAGGEAAIEIDDLWHLGSCVKSISATLMGRLVEEGELAWDTSLQEIFPELAAELGPELGRVTVEQLLSHRAGLPREPRYGDLGEGSPSAQRLEALRQAARRGLKRKPGKRYAYSNLGYIIAGAVIERLTGRSYEEAMGELLYGPLGMRSVAFECETPRGGGHVLRAHKGNGRPVSPEQRCDNDPAVLRPAGCLRSSLEDWARFIRHHLEGERGGSDYLGAETYRALHRSRGDDSGLGWLVLERPWGGGTVLQHAGSNLWNYSNVWIAPRKGFALFVCTHQGDSFEATDVAAGRLIQLREAWQRRK